MESRDSVFSHFWILSFWECQFLKIVLKKIHFFCNFPSACYEKSNWTKGKISFCRQTQKINKNRFDWHILRLLIALFVAYNGDSVTIHRKSHFRKLWWTVSQTFSARNTFHERHTHTQVYRTNIHASRNFSETIIFIRQYKLLFLWRMERLSIFFAQKAHRLAAGSTKRKINSMLVCVSSARIARITLALHDENALLHFTTTI